MKTIAYSRSKHVLYQVAVFVTLFVWWGCATPKPTIVKKTRLEPVSENDKKVTKNGVSISLTPVIGEEDASPFPELASSFIQMEQQLFKEGLQPVEYKISNIFAGTNVFQGTALVIKIANNTGNTISLDGITITANIRGKDFQMEEFDALNQKFISKNLTQMSNTLSSLNYVGKSSKQKVLPGKSATLYAAFNTKISEGTGTITFQIYDLVTKTDAAGNPTERTNFDFSYNEITTAEPVKN
jgi:hypothetical protein